MIDDFTSSYLSLDPAQLAQRQTFLEQLVGTVQEVAEVIRSDLDLATQGKLQEALERLEAVKEQILVVVSGEINKVASLTALIRGQIASEIEKLLAQALSYQALGMGDLGAVPGVLGQFQTPLLGGTDVSSPVVSPVGSDATVIPGASPLACPTGGLSTDIICEPIIGPVILPPLPVPVPIPCPTLQPPQIVPPGWKCIDPNHPTVKGTITVTDDGGIDTIFPQSDLDDIVDDQILFQGRPDLVAVGGGLVGV